jgi:hypothetical protein
MSELDLAVYNFKRAMALGKVQLTEEVMAKRWIEFSKRRQHELAKRRISQTR